MKVCHFIIPTDIDLEMKRQEECKQFSIYKIGALPFIQLYEINWTDMGDQRSF